MSDRPPRWNQHPLLHAALRGDVGGLRAALEEYPPNLQVEGTTALFAAASQGHTLAVELLLERGADPNLEAMLGSRGVPRSPMAEACRRGHFSCAEVLASHGGRSTSNGGQEEHPLLGAVQRGQRELLLQLIASGVRVPPDLPQQPLFGFAASRGDSEVLQALVRAGADPQGAVGPSFRHLQPELYRRAIALARKDLPAGWQVAPCLSALGEVIHSAQQRDAAGRLRDLEVAASMLQGPPVKLSRRLLEHWLALLGPVVGAGSAPLLRAFLAIHAGARELLREPASVRLAPPHLRGLAPPLLVAARLGHAQLIPILVEHWCDPNASFGDEQPFTAALTSRADDAATCATLRALLNAGASTRALKSDPYTLLVGNKGAAVAEFLHGAGVPLVAPRRAKGTTALHACLNALGGRPGHPASDVEALLRFLIPRWPNLESRDEYGWTPLHYAAFRLHPEAVRGLLAAGASVDPTTDAGATPLWYLCSRASGTGSGEIREALLAAKANPALATRRPIRTHGQIEWPTGTTPLHVAAYFGHAEWVQRLVSAGALPVASDSTGATPLHAACLGYGGKDDREAGAIAALTALLDAGAPVNARDAKGRTALEYLREGFAREGPLRLLTDRGGRVIKEGVPGTLVGLFFPTFSRWARQAMGGTGEEDTGPPGNPPNAGGK